MWALFGVLWLNGGSSAQAGWVLVFADEFTNPGVNYMKWSTDPIWAPQPINQQLHFDAPDAFYVKDGKIRLIARKRAMGSQQYTSGYLATLNHFHFTYGYVAVRARFPQGRGFWPALWMVPADKSWPPEIDIIENLGHEPTVGYMTFHYAENGVKKQIDKRFTGTDLSQWHTYAVDWSPGRIIWYRDGKERFRVSSLHVPAKPMYVIVNLAVGGSWAGPPDATTPFPSRMGVDFVRIYQQRNGEGTATIPTWSTPTVSTPNPVNTVPSFIVRPTIATPAALRAGQKVALATEITANIDLNGSQTVFYVRDSGGGQVGRKDFNRYDYAGLAKQKLSFDFPAGSGFNPGTYTVDVGLFTPDWKLLRWAGGIGRFRVE